MNEQPRHLAYRIALCLLFAVVAYSAYAIKGMNIPYGPFWGLDFHNLHTFHNCQFADNPYVVTRHGSLCGDVLDRPIVYPPLYYWTYAWTRGLTHIEAYSIFVAGITLAMIMSLAITLKLVKQFEQDDYSPKTRNLLILFWVLLLFTLPFFASIERGNTDPFVVLLWMLGTYCFLQRQFIAWASISGVAMMYKIYPAVPTAVIGIAIIASYARQESKDYKTLLQIIGSGFLAMLLVSLMWWQQLVTYATDFFPWYADSDIHIQPFSHTIQHLKLIHPYLPAAAMACIFLGWCYFAARYIFRDPLMVFFGCLGISTYFAAVSYVYNLVTLYPLFCLLLLRSRTWQEVAFLIAGVQVFIGDPEIWDIFAAQEWRVLANALWLVLLIPLYSTRLAFYRQDKKPGYAFPPLQHATRQ